MVPEDFYAIVGILIHLGYRKIPRYRLMWSPVSLCYDPVVSKVLSRNKFESYCSFLHVVNEATENMYSDRGDKLAKVRPLLDHLESKCKELYQPNREISIDERMVRSKARFCFRQYIRNKPIKWGFKLWCLCDSHNGYTCAFAVYRGKSGEVRSSKGLGYDVVLNLIEPYLCQGYSLCIGNFYTSPTLVSDLYSLNVHVTGTLDCSRIGVPDEIADLKRKFSKSAVARGDGAYVQDGLKVYCVWKDTKCVCVMSSEHPGHSSSTVSRNVKDKSGKSCKKDVPIPNIIYNYNRYMNGVDRSDQLIKYYNVLRQTKKYWKTLFFHFIDIAVVNSFIIYKGIQNSRIAQFAFRESLVRELCKIETSVQQSVAGRMTVSLLFHKMEKLPSQKDCAYCRIAFSKRRRTTRQCSQCKAPLCFLARNCFHKFHSAKFRKQRENCSRTGVDAPKGWPQGSIIPKGRGRRRKKNW